MHGNIIIEPHMHRDCSRVLQLSSQRGILKYTIRVQASHNSHPYFQYSLTIMSSNVNTGTDESAFYGRLLVLSSLNSLDRNRYHRIERLRGPAQPFLKASSDSTEIGPQAAADEEKLRVFLDCLAELCASARDGRTVTAVTVHLPKTNRPPQYVFVSNGRSKNETGAAKTYIEGMLKDFENVVHDYPGFSQTREVVPAVSRAVLGKALEFNQHRFKKYVRIIYDCLRKLSKRNNLNKNCE